MGEGGEKVVVRKAIRYSSEDVHDAVFTKRPRARKLQELKDGIRRYLREKRARR